MPAKHAKGYFLTTIIATVIATVVATAIIGVFNLTVSNIQNSKEIIDTTNGIYIGCNQEWVDDKLGHAVFTLDSPKYLEQIYITEYALVRIFFGKESGCCDAFFVTLTNDSSIGKIKFPKLYSYILDGKKFGKVSYYEIQNEPMSVYGYVTQGDARSLYSEKYYFGAGNYYTFYFMSLDYGNIKGHMSFSDCFVNVAAGNAEEIDDEVDSSEYRNDCLYVLGDRKSVYPNTYGVAGNVHLDEIESLIYDYHSFESKQLISH